MLYGECDTVIYGRNKIKAKRLMRCFRSFRACYCCESKEFPLAVDFELIYPGKLVSINTLNVMKKTKTKTKCAMCSL